MNRGGLLAKIKANRDKLDACPGHRFSGEIPGIAEGSIGMLGQKIECLRCKGGMDLVALNYYVRGYEAAGGNGNDVLPGWREEQPTNERRYFKPE